MRLNRTCTALAVASVSAIVALPIVVAAPAGAQPVGVLDEIEPPSALEVGVLPDPDPPADPVEGSDSVLADSALAPAAIQIEKAAEPVTDPIQPVVDPDADAVSASEDQAPAALEVPSSPDGSDSPDSSDSDSSDSGSADTDGSADQSSDQASDEVDGVAAAEAGENAEESAEASTDSANSNSASSGSGVAGENTARVEPLAATGAAVGELMRYGLALVVGGIVVVGAGRHRRPGPARII